MPAPVVHFEIIGTDPGALRAFYRDLFGWCGETSPTSDLISDAGQYVFINPIAVPGGNGIAGGIGGGPERVPRLLFYVAVPDVEDALVNAERFGGRRYIGPSANGKIVIGQFADPEGNLVGVAGPR